MENPLVSIIIPCYNAETWIREAIHSCIEQTYKNIEIIVVDDGSTDDSLKILEQFFGKITLEVGPNRGGNYARNYGFSLSTGEYIQFLDADDYLLPPKIEYQTHFLMSSGADVVYGDWQHKHHLPNGASFLGEPVFSGAQADVLESLLQGWWVSPATLLFRREIVESSGGWDESLKAAQDRDFFTSVALLGANIQYQPGCYAVYRRYGEVTVSTSNRMRWLESHSAVLAKAETELARQGRFSPNSRYRKALAKSYYSLAHISYDIDLTYYNRFLAKVLDLDPQFKPAGSLLHKVAYRVGGVRTADRLARIKRLAIKKLILQRSKPKSHHN